MNQNNWEQNKRKMFALYAIISLWGLGHADSHEIFKLWTWSIDRDMQHEIIQDYSHMQAMAILTSTIVL